MPLSDELHKKIVAFSEKGNDFFDDDNFSAAQAEYEAAFKLIPLPKNKINKDYNLPLFFVFDNLLSTF